MDPLEDVLTLLETRSHLSTSLVAGGRWALRFEAPQGVKFNAIRRGSCLLEVDGVDGSIPLEEGDCYLLARPRPFVLRSDPATTPVDAGPVFARADGGVARAGRGDEVFLVGGRFSFGARAQELLLDRLPPVVHVPAGSPHAETVRSALDLIDQELTRGEPAASLVAEHLAVVMLVHVLRLYLARDPHAASGWLAGLSDPVVAAALTALHRDPARPWTVAELARRPRCPAPRWPPVSRRLSGKGRWSTSPTGVSSWRRVSCARGTRRSPSSPGRWGTGPRAPSVSPSSASWVWLPATTDGVPHGRRLRRRCPRRRRHRPEPVEPGGPGPPSDGLLAHSCSKWRLFEQLLTCLRHSRQSRCRQ